MTALDTLFLMALIINKGKWLLVAFLPLWYNERRYHPYTGTERGCATMSIFSSFLPTGIIAYAFRHFKYALLPPLVNGGLAQSCLSNAVRFLSCWVALLPFSDCLLRCSTPFWSTLFYFFS